MTPFKITPELDECADIGILNEALERLTVRRVELVAKKGPLKKSKLAWKVATYKEALLYRTVALTNGCAAAWNRDDVLGCALHARALVETVAVLMDLDKCLDDLLSSEDLVGLDELIMNRSFSTRDKKWEKQHPNRTAVNILTIVKRVDKKNELEGMLTYYYAALSELCHPNRGGHLGLFGTLDRTAGEVRYSAIKSPVFTQVIAPVMLIGLAERAFDRLDEAVLRLAELQHRKNPVGSRHVPKLEGGVE
jgi:hypothetical protein